MTAPLALSLMERAAAQIEWDDDAFEGVLERLNTEGTIDAEGVRIPPERLARILDAAPRDPRRPGQALFKRANFNRATFHDASFGGGPDLTPFESDAKFAGPTFAGHTSFQGATFVGVTSFAAAVFGDYTWFTGATFEGETSFAEVDFGEHNPSFGGTTFESNVCFGRATFRGDASFVAASFQGEARFDGVTFRRDAEFKAARFQDEASFAGATFHGVAEFDETAFENNASFVAALWEGDERCVTFEDDARFRGGSFQGAARFDGTTFKSEADFRQATFARAAHFKDTRFGGDAHFEEASFTREAHFPKARFDQAARFRDAVFKGYAHFPDTTFGGQAELRGADLKAGFRLGPALVRGGLVLDSASLGDLDMRLSTCLFSCRGTRFHGPAHIQIRWAEIQLEEAVFDRTSTLALLTAWNGADETTLRCRNEHEREPPGPRRGTRPRPPPEMPRLVSLTRADVGDLTLADIDLSLCDFGSTLRLDEMRLATLCPFDEPPSGRLFKGASFPYLWAWTKRITIHDERCWRVSTPKGDGWSRESVKHCFPPEKLPSEAERLAKIYRALRKGREDEGNAPGAGDFYYGEMEMRRHGHASPERVVIWLYWLVSGYGLRASRALAALAITVVAFAVGLYLFGLKSPDAGTALLQSVEGATLRSGDRDVLTGWGKGLQVALRLLGPLFFGLALLSLRGRVKR